MNAEAIAHALNGHRTANGFVCRCPAHEDNNPSLSVAERGGKILLKCFAGCSQESVIAALKGRGLWPEAERREHPEDWGTIVQTYKYTDEDGNLLFEVCRFMPKSFRPRRSNGRGGWTWGYGDVRRVLYRLPEVLEAPIVFVVEGEKDVESLRNMGFVATTNAGGANAPWLPEFTETLAGREVILIPDNDKPGRERVARIARALIRKAARVIILTLDDGSKDVSEWFHRGHSELELIAMVEGSEVRQ